MVQEGFKDKRDRRAEQHNQQQQNQERRRRSKRKQASSVSRSSSSSLEPDGIIGRAATRRDSKLASHKREHESRGTRTRRRPNGGSLSSRGSATGMQCGLCAVLASLFRRAMCIAGSRRGSGESCYEELATEMQQQAQVVHPAQLQQQVPSSQSRTIIRCPINVVLPPNSRSASIGSLQRLKEPLQQEKPTAEVTVDSTGQNAVFVRISEDASLPTSGTSPLAATSASCPAASETATETLRRLSETDRILIENLDIGRCRTRHTGRFLTMHKRRRKRLITRSLNQEPGLLDDIFHGQVQCVLQRAGHWRFNAFTLETVTGGRSLPVLCVHLFQWYGLFQRFKLDVVRVWKLFALIEEGYHSTNPYHNSIHATDVTQAMHCFLQEEKIKRHLSSLEIMASLIAAVTHDLDHPGVNQPFLVATSNHLATLYENTSVLENHHWRSAIGCLLESGVSEQLPAQVRPELQRHISSLILATDITRQQEFLTRFKSYLDKNALDMELAENRHFVLQISLKCADISNPCRPWDISRKWSYKVCEEFFRQGDYERQLNLSVTPLCDRQTISIPKIQAGFFEFVVTPLYEEWHRFLGDGLSVSLMLHLRGNKKRWEAMIAEEAAEKAKAEQQLGSEMEGQIVQISSNSDDEQLSSSTQQVAGSVELLLPEVDAVSTSARQTKLPGEIAEGRRVDRRHSVPLSAAKAQLSLLPRDSESRRESLPIEQVKPSRNSLCRLEDNKTGEEALRKLSSVSLLSSKSSVYESAGYASSSYERPVSAENLLPEPSIASITSSVEASRLSTVLQPENSKKTGSLTTTKHLTRQQTFPPLQPYSRIRYMSTTAEMSKCRTETLMEADDSPSSSEPSSMVDKSSSGGQRCSTCSEVDCDSWKQNKVDCGSARVSRSEHLTDNNQRGSRHRESAFSDLTRQSLDTRTHGSEFPRRHSVQAVHSEDPNLLGLKHRHRRPSSAQEAYPTQMLYASLIGASSQVEKSPIVSENQVSDCKNDFRKNSDNNPDSSLGGESSLSDTPVGQQRESPNSCSYSSNIIGKKSPGLSQLADKCREQSELRRYSAPLTQSRSVASGESGGRRFTAIPVTSELPIHKVFFIGSPPESPGVHSGVSSSTSESGSDRRPSIGGEPSSTEGGVSVGAKRDSECIRQKSSKFQKLSDDGRMKENVDPRAAADDSNKSGGISSSRRTSQAWARRRGSAPVGLLARLDDSPIGASGVASRNERHSSRRGSVPTDVTVQQAGGSFRAALGPRGENIPSPRRASLPQEAALSNLLGNALLRADERENFPINNNNNNNNNSSHTGSNNNGSSRVTEASTVSGGMPSPRRGSVPADISELRRDLFGRNSVNGKTRNRKKTLRRRSSGGPEMFAGGNVDDNDNGKWLGCKRELSSKRDSIPEPSVKRRGSLPVEMVSIFHPGSAAGARRSSLWRL